MMVENHSMGPDAKELVREWEGGSGRYLAV